MKIFQYVLVAILLPLFLPILIIYKCSEHLFKGALEVLEQKRREKDES